MEVMPLVSVIVPAHNAAETITQTLRSACRQTYARLEVIVVDDGSVDATSEHAEAVAAHDPRVQVVRQPNAGVAAARNRGIALSRGAYVAPLDADDTWDPHKIERQLCLLSSAAPRTGLAYCGWEIRGAGGRRLGRAEPRHEGDVFDVLVRRNIIGCASAPLIRRACLDHVGGYDVSMHEQGCQGCEDWDLYLRLAEHYHFCVDPDPLVTYHKSSGTMSTSAERMERSYRVLQASLQARRPELPQALHRQSEQIFLLYLARICSANRDMYGALRYLVRAFRTDPALALARIPSRQGLSVAASLVRSLRSAS